MKWHTEFPDYPATEMPGLPAGFENSSFYNDMCPSFTSDQLGLTVWVDYPHPDDREFPNWVRFRITPQNHGVDVGGDSLETDDWAEVLAFITTRTLSLESKG